MDGARSSAQRRRDLPPCDARAAARADALTRRLRALRRTPEQFLDRILRRDRVDRQAGPELEPGDLAQARVDLPVPVVRRVDLLAQRRGMEHEVVGRAVEARRQPAEHLAERLGGGRDVRSRRPPEVGLVAARHDPHLERRARGVRREGHARVVLPDEPVRPPRFVAHEPAERALALADDEPRRAAELLGDPVRDLGQVVQVEAQVVGPGARLGAPVLDDLEVVGLAGRAGLGERVAGTADELARSCALPTAWSGRCSPAARRSSAS